MKQKFFGSMIIILTLLALGFGAAGITPAHAAKNFSQPHRLATSMTPDDGSVLDLLVVWTPAAETAIGSAAKMTSWIDGMVLRTNMAFRNSGINTRLVLVYKGPVTYTEVVSLTDLTALKDGTGGLSVAHTLRDTYHADLVLMVRQGSGTEGGQAYQLTTVSTASSEAAYGVVRTVSDWIFPHELGHMLSSSHSWYTDGAGNAPYTYAHGHHSPTSTDIPTSGTRFADIMTGALSSFLGAFNGKILAYANPDLTYRGVPMGVAAGTKSDCVAENLSQAGLCDADLRTAFNNTAPVIAQFRSSEARWTGAVNTDWNTAGNWDATSGNPASPTTSHIVPRAIDNVLIPAGLSNYPAISGSASARDVKIESGASLTMSGGPLTVSGKWQASGAFTASGGTVVFNAALDKPMSLQMSGGSYFNHLQIGDGTAMPWIQLGSALAVHGNLTLGAGSLFQPGSNQITLTGNWQDNGAGFDYASSNVVFNGSGQTANAVASATVFSQNFSAYDGTASLTSGQPYGWDNMLGDTIPADAFAYWYFGDMNNSDGHSGIARRDYAESSNMDAWLFTPAVNLGSGVHYRLKFDYSLANTTGTSNFSASYGSHLLPSTMSSPIVTAQAQGTVSGNWATANQTFTVPSSNAYNLGLRNYETYSAGVQSFAYLDNIILTIEPSIPPGFGGNPGNSDDFVITVKTDNPGASGSTQFTIPTYLGETYNYNVDCNNDGTDEATAQTGDYTCIYGAAGTYTIHIKDNTGLKNGFPRIYFYSEDHINDDAEKLLTIAQWGTGKWTSMVRAFQYCSNMTMSATDAPNLSGVTDMSNMFDGASAFNGNISAWDTSSVTAMGGMFSNASAFNQPIGSWNTSNVIYMDYMFANASAFNQDISTWNVGALTDANEMFTGATLSIANYDALLKGWDAQALKPSVPFGGGNSTYCEGAAAREQMISSDGWTITDGGEDPACSTPSTTINHHTGAPGSLFNITGANYPANVQSDISVNGVDVGTADINANGNFSLTLETAPTSDEGIYQVAATVESQPEPSDTVLYELDASAPEREQEGSLPVQSVPEEIAPFLPQLDINYPTGAPGSFFNITGTDYPVNVESDISVNGVDVGTVEIDANGSFSVTLQTTPNSEEGTYNVEVTLESQPEPSGDVQYELDANAPVREQEGGLPVLPVPEEIAPAPLKFIYLPLVIR